MGSFDNCCPLCMKGYNKIYYINTIYIIGINTSKGSFESLCNFVIVLVMTSL